MAYEVLGTCMLVPGFNRGECASWVQAVGSIVAIVAAVGIFVYQRILERRDQDEVWVACAKVVAQSVVIRIGNLQGAINQIQAELDKGEGRSDALIADRYDLLSRHVLPTEEQMLQLAPVVPEVANALAVATGIVEKVLKLCEPYATLSAMNPGRSKSLAENIIRLSPFLLGANEQITIAQDGLRDLVVPGRKDSFRIIRRSHAIFRK